MSARFRLSITFLDPVPRFGGRGDGGEPEWPPSPLRAFSALVAAAAARWRGPQFESYAVPALDWLERLDTPTLMAPHRHMGQPFRTAVPNNDLDKWARDLSRRRPIDKQPSELKALKPINPSYLINGATVHYDWPLTPEQFEQGKTHLETLKAAARSITHLGWGVDQAVGHAELLTADPPADSSAERWVPADGDTPLRVPQPGTLADLRAKHAAFLGRLDKAGFKPVPPLTTFRVVGYRRAADPAGRPWAAFELLKPDADEGGRLSRDPVRGTRDVAAWVRHAVAEMCKGWPHGDIEQFVHGHDGPDRPFKGDGADRRFQYLPLPTITPLRVESIRRVLVTAPPGCELQIEWLKQRLSGRPLEQNGAVVGLLNRLPDGDWVRRQYTRPSKEWSTVTPVLLPGYDDRDRRRAERLLWKAFEDAGLSPEALAGSEAEWQAVGYRAGVEPAWRFEPAAENAHWPRYHVRVRFARPVSGPLAVGAGRYRGFGLFVTDGD